MTRMTEPNSLPGAPLIRPSYLNMAKVWVLSNFLGNNTLCNRVIDRFLQKWDSMTDITVAVNTVRYIFDSTSEDSKLRQLLIDAMSARVSKNWMDKCATEAPHALLVAFSQRYACGMLPQPPGPTQADRCKYHTHDEGEEKCM